MTEIYDEAIVSAKSHEWIFDVEEKSDFWNLESNITKWYKCIKCDKLGWSSDDNVIRCWTDSADGSCQERIMRKALE